MEKERIIEAARDGNLFDFIACNYPEMSKSELKDICLELADAAYCVMRNDKNTYNRFIDILVDNISERVM